MKFVHLAASLLLFNTGILFAQSGYNGPAPLSAPSPESASSSEVFQSELEGDNFNRIQSTEQAQYFSELTFCLLPDQPELEQVEDSRLADKMLQLEHRLLLSLDEQAISDPDAEEEGIELLNNEVLTQQAGQVALLGEQLSTVMTEYQSQENEYLLAEYLLLEDFFENQEPTHWLVQVELGQIR